jgi:hypothetical protein
MDEVRAGEFLLTFDGQVLEVFGWLRRNFGIADAPSLRFHVAHLQIEVDDPDRKQHRWVKLRLRDHGSVGSDICVEEADWPGVSRFLDQVQAALRT